MELLLWCNDSSQQQWLAKFILPFYRKQNSCDIIFDFVTKIKTITFHKYWQMLFLLIFCNLVEKNLTSLPYLSILSFGIFVIFEEPRKDTMNLYPPNLVPFYQGSTIYINLGTIIQYLYSPLYFSMLERANTSNKSFCPGLLLSRYHHWSIVMWPFLQNEPQKSISQPSIFYGWNHTINCMRTLPLVDPKMTMWRRRFHICSSNQEGQNWRDLYKNGRGTLRGSQGSSRGDTWGGDLWCFNFKYARRGIAGCCNRWR